MTPFFFEFLTNESKGFIRVISYMNFYQLILNFLAYDKFRSFYELFEQPFSTVILISQLIYIVPDLTLQIRLFLTYNSGF